MMSSVPPIAAAALLDALVAAVVASARRIEGQRRCSPTAHVSIATVPRSFVSTIVPARTQLPLPPPEPPPVPEVVVAATAPAPATQPAAVAGTISLVRDHALRKQPAHGLIVGDHAQVAHAEQQFQYLGLDVETRGRTYPGGLVSLQDR